MGNKFSEVYLTLGEVNINGNVTDFKIIPDLQSKEDRKPIPGIVDSEVTLILAYSTEIDPELEAMFEDRLEDQRSKPPEDTLDHEDDLSL